MLERFEDADGLVGYRSPLLAECRVPHLFTTRLGEDRAPLDLSTVDERAARLLVRGAGAGDARPALVRQVHRDGVVTVGPGPLADPPPEADALVTAAPGRLLVVRVADCLPVLLAEADGARVAAVHAGWRGLLAGVLERAVAALGARAPLAALGPCISAERFEVGPEVASAFVQAGLAEAVRTGPARPHVDLARAATLRLERLGVTRIDGTDRCTWNGPAEFFSHRRDVTHGGAPTTGRMAAAIAVRS